MIGEAALSDVLDRRTKDAPRLICAKLLPSRRVDAVRVEIDDLAKLGLKELRSRNLTTDTMREIGVVGKVPLVDVFFSKSP